MGSVGGLSLILTVGLEGDCRHTFLREERFLFFLHEVQPCIGSFRVREVFFFPIRSAKKRRRKWVSRRSFNSIVGNFGSKIGWHRFLFFFHLIGKTASIPKMQYSMCNSPKACVGHDFRAAMKVEVGRPSGSAATCAHLAMFQHYKLNFVCRQFAEPLWYSRAIPNSSTNRTPCPTSNFSTRPERNKILLSSVLPHVLAD